MLAMLMLMTVQNVPGPPGDDVAVLPRLTQARQRRCARGEEGEIVVCGGDLQSQRLEPLPDLSTELFRPATVQLSGGKTLNAHAEEGGGYTATPRAMVTLKVPF